MKFLKVAVVHFQPLEKYPPVMNMLIYLEEAKRFQIRVFSTEDKYYKKNFFELKGTDVYRFGSFYKGQSFIRRYINYLVFNLFTFFTLLFTKPSSIICYETLSVFPVYLYKKLFPKTKIFIHYHEYASLNEISKSSFYTKWLNNLEKKMFSKACWISHTNKDRLAMFRENYKQIPFSDLKVLPNYPPSFWRKMSKDNSTIITFPVKFVYVGALGINTTYIKEFAKWIKDLNGKAIFDIYSTNYQEEVLNYLKNINTPFINFLGEVNYYELPCILEKYDIGLVLYNGHIPNYVYNAPNKLFEYHACNLDVWVSEDIKGSLPYATKDIYPKIIAVDFLQLQNFDLNKAIEREGYTFQQNFFNCEDVLEAIKNKLIEVA